MLRSWGLLVVGVLASVQRGCCVDFDAVSECGVTGRSSRLVATCEPLSVSSVPTAIPDNIKHLKLDGCRIPKVSHGDLQQPGLTNLQRLYIRETEALAEIEPGFLTGLHNLQEVYLNDNRIARVKAGTFVSLEDLEILDLSSNAIAVIEPGAFDGLPALFDLYLQSNDVTALLSGVWNDVGEYTMLLDLSDNRLLGQVDSDIWQGLPVADMLSLEVGDSPGGTYCVLVTGTPQRVSCVCNHPDFPVHETGASGDGCGPVTTTTTTTTTTTKVCTLIMSLSPSLTLNLIFLMIYIHTYTDTNARRQILSHT